MKTYKKQKRLRNKLYKKERNIIYSKTETGKITVTKHFRK